MTSTTRTRPARGRTLLLWVALALLVALMAVLIGLLLPRRESVGRNDPHGAKYDGAQALAQVLEGRGVEVDRVIRWRAVQEGPKARTLLVSDPGLLGEEQLQALAGQADNLVLLQPGSAEMSALGAELVAVSDARTPGQGADPGCRLPAARNAGRTELGGYGYRRVPGLDGATVTLCYPFRSPGQAATPDTGMIARWTYQGTTVTALGSDQVLQNGTITPEPGRAALGLWLLGEDRRLTWWMVDPADPAFFDGDSGPVDAIALLPGWVSAVTWWLLAVAALAALWRGRRLGALVSEPLPVVVRSAETAFGRAALYREIRARDRAADLIRARTLARLRPLLGLGPRAGVEEVVAAASSAASGWPRARLDQLLRPTPVPDDATLLTIARDADHLVGSLHWVSTPAAGSPANTQPPPPRTERDTRERTESEQGGPARRPARGAW